MVSHLLYDAPFVLAESPVIPVKLPEPLRTTVLMALLGILLVGLLLIAGTLLGGHWVRRLGSHRRGPAVPEDHFLHLEKNNRKERESSQQPSGSQSSHDTIATDETII